LVNPILYKREDTEACWRDLRAPLLMLVGEKSDYRSSWASTVPRKRFAPVPHMEIAQVRERAHAAHRASGFGGAAGRVFFGCSLG